MLKPPSHPELYDSFSRKESRFDGLYFVAVKTTRIFCRPICPARNPKPENVLFFPTAEECLAAGFRPCKRCHPLDMGQHPPEWMPNLLQQLHSTGATISDSDLIRQGLNPTTVRRAFQKRYGFTFQAVQRRLKMGKALSAIQNGERATTAAMNTDYSSESGFRDAFNRLLGTTPGKAASLQPAYARWIETPLGPMIAIAVPTGLALLEFADRVRLDAQIQRFQRLHQRTLVTADHPLLSQTESELAEYFARQRTQFSVPLDQRGTEFQQTAWRALTEIPFGETRSYGQQAAAIGKPSAVRAIAAANANNAIAIIVPCHRVIESGGKLRGYAGGLWRKQRLLSLESGLPTLDL